MNERDRRTLIRHGALVFLAGMAAGFPYAIEILGRFELWPLPINIAMEMPGDTRAWRMIHMEGILNGLLLISVAAVGSLLTLSERGAAWVTKGLLVCAWGNIAASWVAALSETRGLHFGGIGWNGLVYLLFVAAIVGILGAMSFVWAGSREPRADRD